MLCICIEPRHFQSPGFPALFVRTCCAGESSDDKRSSDDESDDGSSSDNSGDGSDGTCYLTLMIVGSISP